MAKIRSQVLTFVTEIARENKEIDEESLISIWNKLNINNKISDDEIKAGKPIDKDTGCKEIMKSGVSQGMRCGKKCEEGKDMCSAHLERYEKNKNVTFCKEITKQGTQCTRKATIDGLCVQHNAKKSK
jgi:hypothetical protein